jgi:lipopolysaccharide transport system ATP-binding protein
MNDIAIRADGLGKKYRIGGQQQGYKTLRDTLSEIFMAPFRRAKGLVKGQSYGAAERNQTIWALKDVTFQINRGEVVGIIGRNGAGKTTLLKILSRITEPTEGQAEIYGRVGSLLEVGTGFHPELTGRENIYLNGAILGMRKAEIEAKFDEIVSFAEIEKFIDTPVKHYSSGMYVRLAFAVAAHLEPEILLVDEVLAVGDASFQKKCLGKMGDVAAEGRTVLFVSHNMVAVQSLCSRAVWLHQGRVMEISAMSEVISKYLTTFSPALTEQEWGDVNSAPGNESVRLHRVCIYPESGPSSGPFTIRTPLVMVFEFWNLRPGINLNLTIHLVTEQEIIAFASAPVSSCENEWIDRPFPVGLFRSTCKIPGDLLNAGMYRVRLIFGKDDRVVIYKHDDALSFEVQDSADRRGKSHHRIVGSVRPLLKWKTEMIETDSEISSLVSDNIE